ncbi:MAG: toll/interleukin-1 receptor domain-containing protein [Chloroflexi bacterium]|nr:toll/interleukin-1 receptor domain-containing protein [Chloroflexota bacterium]
MAQYIIKQDDFQYDVFLSHASEDKDEVARPLALLLQERGLRVWYDEFELRFGDDLSAALNQGISASRFGILVLSKRFFEKDWTTFELNTLEYLAVTEDRVLFPFWHEIGESEVRAYRPSLARLLAWSTAANTVEQIADAVYELIKRYYQQKLEPRNDEH